MKKMFIIAVLFISLNSCTDAKRAKIVAFGDTFKVEMINCDGSVTYHWISTGKVSNSENSDGYYFNDAKTNTLIEVSGNVIITRLK